MIWIPDGRRLAAWTGNVNGTFLTVRDATPPDGKPPAPAPEEGNKPAGKETEPLVVGDLRYFGGHTGQVTSVALSADGKRALSGSFDKTLRLWDVDAGKELRRPDCPKDLVEGLAFSPDGKQAAAAHADKTVRLYDPDSGKELRRFDGHTDKVGSVAFSPDGRRLLSGGADKTLRLWDAATGRELFCFEGHGDKVRGVAFSPDGRRALSGSYDRSAKVWGLPR